MNLFDLRLGAKFIDTIPTDPGIYQVYDQSSQLIYVGKAKNLRRRLSQYRNAKRRKKHRKMRKIIDEAASVQYLVCTTPEEAELVEAKWIQTHRPKWNVAGAFSFLYPMIGMKWVNGQAHFCYTTEPAHFSDFELHGAFRSRYITRGAFFALIKLLKFVGHPLPKDKKNSVPCPKFSYRYAFRQLDESWFRSLADFWKGESKEPLEELILFLVENAAARKKGKEIQQFLNDLNLFWKHESHKLGKVRKALQYGEYPVPQVERDFLFLKYRHHLQLKAQRPRELQPK